MMTEPTMTAETDEAAAPRIEFYGAGWCGDCRRAKFVLDRLHIGYTYHDVEASMDEAREAMHISGSKHIPVLQFEDGAFQVEPSATELIAKINELGLVPGK